MNKKEYTKPVLQLVSIRTMQMIANSLPGMYNEYSSNASYARRGSIWDDEEEFEDEEQ